MLQLVRPAAAESRGELFCVDPSHGLYSHAARGYVNLRGEVLLRGHDRADAQLLREALVAAREQVEQRERVRQLELEAHDDRALLGP